MPVYYNEFDRQAAAWLRELMKDGLIPDGEVDERDIRDVRADDVRSFRQCHFFAGIGGWPLALQLAGWRGPAWTGSCPCQPFSCAGKRLGERDERHLWPEFERLISECRPPVVLGEQVAGKGGIGWISGVRTDLEAQGYAVGVADLPAAGVGSPHIRQRLYWVAHTTQDGRRQGDEIGRGRLPGADAPTQRLRSSECCESVRAANPEHPEQREHISGSATSFWSSAIWHPCRDGKARRIPAEPALFPLAHGVPGRVGLLRGAGNAIVPPLAAEFIKAVMDAMEDENRRMNG